MRSLILVIGTGLMLGGCFGANYKKTCTNGVCKVEKDGEVTYTGDPEKVAALQAKDEEQQRAAEEREKRLREGPKRKEGDPITVAILQTELGGNMQKADIDDRKMYEMLYKQFENDDVLRLVGKNRMEEVAARIEKEDRYRSSIDKEHWIREMKELAINADVYLYTHADFKEFVGISKKSGKLGTGMKFVIKAKVSSGYIVEEHELGDEGQWFQLKDVLERFAETVKTAIKNDIGPTLPALSSSRSSSSSAKESELVKRLRAYAADRDAKKK